MREVSSRIMRRVVELALESTRRVQQVQVAELRNGPVADGWWQAVRNRVAG